jgi:arylsulfatase A-like enzyme/Flp pilus assembly protein TadD
LALALATAAACGSGESRLAGRPAPASEREIVAPALPVDHLLLITVDTLRADALGFAGNASVATPTLDRLARAGVVFTDAHAHNVVTLPSHANILTGRYPYQHGVRDNQGFRLPPEVPTLATVLADAGFATAAFIAAFPLDSRFGLDRGFAVYDDHLSGNVGALGARPLERSGDEVVALARRWWSEHAGRRRFLWIHLFEPHAPYEPPAEFAGRYPDMPYLGEVSAVDAYLTPLLEPFLASREAPTLIAFTSDHGEALGDHGELTHGLFAYEPTLKVPLVLWAPGLAPGRRQVPARHIDLAPTLLAAAGVAAPPDLPGRSLLAPSGPEDADSYFESLTATLDRGWAPLRGTIRGGAKLIDLPLLELYDLANDPEETDNRSRTQPQRAEALRAGLPPESVWPPQRGAVSAEEERALRALGYLGGGASAKSVYTVADDPKNLVDLDRKVHQVIDLYERGRLAEAAALGREVVAARPDMGVASYYLAQVLLAGGQRDEALAVMVEAQRRGSSTPVLVRQLALTLAEVGRLPEAVRALERAVAGGDPDDLAALGLVLSEGGSQDEARAALERALATDPGHAVAWQHLALTALRRDDFAAARQHAERALAENDGLGLAWSYLGSARYNLGDPRGALAAWEQAVAIDPTDFDALYNIGLVAPEVGEREKAREALEQFLAGAPRDRYGADLDDARRRLATLG